tara:strand:- start:44 stop:220 length:177 start_codon:yes stop_codon:yes gene_type:complete
MDHPKKPKIKANTIDKRKGINPLKISKKVNLFLNNPIQIKTENKKTDNHVKGITHLNG